MPEISRDLLRATFHLVETGGTWGWIRFDGRTRILRRVPHCLLGGVESDTGLTPA